jgi:hypothetical protein
MHPEIAAGQRSVPEEVGHGSAPLIALSRGVIVIVIVLYTALPRPRAPCPESYPSTSELTRYLRFRTSSIATTPSSPPSFRLDVNVAPPPEVI